MFVNRRAARLTLLGGLQAVAAASGPPAPAWSTRSPLLAAFAAISGLIDLPFEYYRQFVLEAKFGFNKMTPRLFIADMAKAWRWAP